MSKAIVRISGFKATVEYGKESFSARDIAAEKFAKGKQSNKVTLSGRITVTAVNNHIIEAFESALSVELGKFGDFILELASEEDYREFRKEQKQRELESREVPAGYAKLRTSAD